MTRSLAVACACYLLKFVGALSFVGASSFPLQLRVTNLPLDSYSIQKSHYERKRIFITFDILEIATNRSVSIEGGFVAFPEAGEDLDIRGRRGREGEGLGWFEG